MTDYKKLACVLLVSAALSACSSTGGGPKEVAGSVSKTDSSITTLSVYENAKTQYQTWLDKLNAAEPLKLYSPEVYKDTLSAWADAVDIYEDFVDDPAKAVKDYSFFSSGTYAERFDAELAKVNVQYEKLLALKARADKILAESIEQMAYLEQISSAQYYPDEFKQVKEEYTRLFAYVADKELSDAQNKQAEFLHRAKKLELNTVLRINITPLEKESNLLYEKGISTQAPISYAKAKAELALATQLVKTDPRNSAVIEKAVNKVKFELAHTTNVAAEVRHFRTTESGKFENVILELENQLLAISNALDGSDFRDLPLRSQSKQIVARLSQVLSTHDTTPLENQIKALKAQLNNTQDQVKEQAAQKAELQQQLERSQANLNLREAQVSALQTSLDETQLKLSENLNTVQQQQLANEQIAQLQQQIERDKDQIESLKQALADAFKSEAKARVQQSEQPQ